MHRIGSARRTTRLARELAAAFALLGFSLPAFAGNLLVGNCADDDSTPSLRKVVASAVDDDVVDLSTLVCSTITLAADKGPIPITKRITLNGISIAGTRIEGNGSRVFTISGGPRVRFQNMTIAQGSVYNAAGDAVGGCISSDGYVSLSSSALSFCSAVAKGGTASGGALFASGGAYAQSAYFRQNHATSDTLARGGALYAANALISHATISGNYASGPTQGQSEGGGAFVTGVLTVSYSTVDHNQAGAGGGIFHVFSNDPPAVGGAFLYETTFSTNSAVTGGGLQEECSGSCTSAQIYNSTFAFNDVTVLGAGILSSVDIAAHSSIFANNSPASADDIYLEGVPTTTLQGGNNLLMHGNFVPQPGVVTVTADPALTPLDFHGASTPVRTHGLSASSPALAGGNNVANLSFDERGDGFPREVDGHVDIGAFQRQANDEELFYGGFQ